MTCCPPYTQPFSNTIQTIVNYGENMVEQYGKAPKLTTYFFDSGVYNVINNPDAVIVGDKLTITHPLIATGWVKIS